MKTCKKYGIAAAAWAALVCTMAMTATAADGDIWSIRHVNYVNDQYISFRTNDAPYSMDNPIPVGSKAYFKFRLLNRDPQANFLAHGGLASDTTWNNMWQRLPKDLSNGKVATNVVDMVNATNFPLKVGVWINGANRLANVEEVRRARQTADDMVTLNYDFTDVICSYRVEPGDFGIVQLTGVTIDGRLVPASSAETLRYYLSNTDYWGFFDTLTKTNACNFWFTSQSQGAISPYVTFPTDDDPKFVQDRDLSTYPTRIYVKTIDFDSAMFDSSAEPKVWRQISAGSTDTSEGGGFPTLTINKDNPADETHKVTLYAWTEDETIARMNTDHKETFTNGIQRFVQAIEIGPGDGLSKVLPNSIYASPDATNKTTTIYLSATPTNIFKAGILITNFVTQAVRVGPPLRPSLNIIYPEAPKDKSGMEPSKYSMPTPTDAAARYVPVGVKIKGETYTNDLTVTITAEMVDPASTNSPYSFIGLSDEQDVPYGTSVTVSIPAYKTNNITPAYIYVKRASDDTSDPTKGIRLTASVESAVTNFFSGGINSGTLYITKANPVITFPANDTVYNDVPAGEEYEMSFNVVDAYGELSGNYTLEYTLSGIWSSMNTKTLDIGKPSGSDNTLTTNLIFNTTSSNILVRVRNQDGYVSDPIHLTVNVFAKPLISATPYDHVGTDDNPSRTYNEGDTAKLSFTLGTPFALADAGYIFLVPQTEASSNLVETTAFEQGIRIVRGQSATERQASLLLLDGTANTELRYEFEIWSKPTKTEAGSVRIGTGTDGYASGEITLYVDNVMPTVEGVSMSDTPLFTNNGTMEAKAAKDVTKIFRMESVNEPSDKIDLTNELFLTEWKFYEGGTVLFTTNVYGNPYNAEIPYAFHNSGTNKVTVKVMDKDMTQQQFKQSAGFTFFVETLDEPTISMMPYNGSFYFLEEQVGSINGRVDVKLNIAPTAPIEVEITVERVGADDGLTSDPVLNTNRLTFTSGTTSRYFYFKELDGDANFTVRARVITETQSVDPNKTWAQYYREEEEGGYPMTVENSAPMIQGVADTNAVPAGLNVPATPISWAAKDVLPDIREGMTATLTVEGAQFEIPITTTNASGTVYGEIRGSYSPTFKSAGAKTVTLVVSDKNGKSDTRRYYYVVEPSKLLYLHPLGPKSRAQSLFSSAYLNVEGHGEGRVWADAGTIPEITDFDQKWTYDPGVGSANVYGYGYRVGEQATGLLTPGKDFRLNAAGNVTTGSDLYTYKELFDSFFYCWILETKAEDGNFTGAHLGAIQPAVGTDTTDTAKQPVGMPEYDSDAVIYDDRHVTAIFSREYDAKDNVGDINQDGIPDIYAASVAWSGQADTGFGVGASESAGSRLFEIAGYTSDSAGDLKSLTSYNGDNDYLPSKTSAGGTLIPGISSEWATYGSPFTAYLELRGYGSGLNYRESAATGRGRNSGGRWISEKDFNDLEMIAYSNAWVAAGSSGNLEDFEWTPENRTDPTISDTDGDGLPDGYEYYLWYHAYVGYWEYDSVGDTNVYKRLTGSRFRLQDIGEGRPISPEEIAMAFNPNSYTNNITLRDMDNDGLTDLEEFALGTNPIHWDTDGDGISDYWEVIRGLNPLYAEKEELDSESNPDNDFMAERIVGSDWGVITFAEDDKTGIAPVIAIPHNGPSVIDSSTLKVKAGVTNVEAILVYRYGNASSPVVPRNRGIWRTKTPSSGYKRYECSDDGARPLDKQTFDITKLGEVKSVKVNQTLKLVHDQVRAQYGFDPRTGWSKMSASGFVSPRWEAKAKMGLSGDAVDTRPFRNLDEYLLLKYRYMTSGSITGEAPTAPADNVRRVDAISRNLRYDLLNIATIRSALVTIGALEDQLPDQLTLADIFLEGTTNPNIRYSEKSYGEYSVPSSEDSTDSGNNLRLVTFSNRIHGADTDCDGVPDGWELYVGFDPNDSENREGDAETQETDFDGDSLKLADEYAGTDSCNVYSNAISVIHRQDLDATDDTEEVATIYENHPGNKTRWFNKFFPTDPWDQDTDGDNISDSFEGKEWSAHLVYKREEGAEGVIYPHTFIYKFNDTERTEVDGVYRKVVYTDDSATEPVPVDDGKTWCIRGGGLNPCSIDTDFDNLPDPWEYEFAGVLFTPKGLPDSVPLSEESILMIRRSDGLAISTNSLNLAGYYVTAGMDGTHGHKLGTTYTGDQFTTDGFDDERTGTNRDYDFDQDGLQNFQEYLVQSLRHLRYDDSETPLMGRWMPGGSIASEKFIGFLPMNVMDGETFYKEALQAGFVGSSAWNFRELGYFARPPREWDIAALRPTGSIEDNGVGCRFMLPPHGLGNSADSRIINWNDAYASTDPRIWDSDYDGMDDYYELFHGLNPLLGSIMDPDAGTGALRGDVIAKAYNSSPINGAQLSFWNNAWRGWPGSSGAAASAWLGTGVYELFDPIRYPWMMGAPEADADGDGIRNSEEALIPNLANPQNTHTDPSPLWLTDSTALNKASYTAQYYLRPASLDNNWAWRTGSAQANDGSSKDFLFSFEENEGYDTDHDWISDSEEQRMTSTPQTDSLNFSDPDRRQAIWFPGDKSAAVSRTDNLHRLNYASYDFLRQFTVEAWIKPEDVSRKQVILERACWYGASTLSNNLGQVRANFLIGIQNGRLYGLYDTSDAIPSESDEGAVKVVGLELVTNEWTHVALVFDGSALKLYMDGTVVASESAAAIPANGLVTFLPEAFPGMLTFPIVESGYSSVPSAMVLGARATGRDGVGLSTNTTWDAYTDFYAGYLDEVRVWDGARSLSGILGGMKKRYTFSDVSALRDEVYAAWANGATRNNSDGRGNLPAELAMHYNFQTLPGAIDPASVQWEPSGFTKKVTMNGRVDGWDVPGDIYCGWWYATPVRSTVYKQYRVVPWIQNTVAHLPPKDGSAIDSRYWSAFFGGMTASNEVGAAKIEFPNTANPYPYYYYIFERYYHKERLERMAKMDLVGNHTALTNYLFELRSTFAGFSDLVPLGSAFAKRCADMWDENGPMEAWTMTRRDTNANGIPDWWEKVAIAQYGAAAGFGWDTIVMWPEPSDPNRREMTAREAYIRDLQRGMVPTGASSGAVDAAFENIADTDNDGLPDWWEDFYGIRSQNGLDDADNDQLSNYAEYLISECFSKFGFRRISPLSAQSFAEDGQDVPDYFLGMGKPYFGEMFADHDFIEDAWEDMFDPDFVSRFKFDAWDDPDGDGWSNWAECRADSDPTLQSLAAVDGYTVVKYPVPDLAVTIICAGGTTLDAPVYVQAYPSSDTSGIPDAVWQIGSSEKQTKYLGMNPNSVLNFTLGSGSVQPGTVVVQLKSSMWKDAEGYIHYLSDAAWVDYVHDTIDTSRPDAKMGLLFFLSLDNVVGTVNYATGEVSIDFTKCQDTFEVGQSGSNITYYPSDSFFVIKWSGVVPNSTTALTMHLRDPLPAVAADDDLIWDEAKNKHPSRGAVREGKNTFVAFLDLDNNGTWSPSEPYGVTPDVDVGWSGTSFKIVLSRSCSQMMRINLRDAVAAEGFEAQSALTDRGVLGGDTAAPANVSIPEGTNMPQQTATDVRVRIALDSINGNRSRIVSGSTRWVSDVPFDQHLNLALNPLLTEKNLLATASGKLDLAWDTFEGQVGNLGLTMDNVTRAIYRIVLGDGLISSYMTNNSLSVGFAIAFDSTRPTCTLLSPRGDVYSQPTFTWKCNSAIGKAYPAFQLSVHSVQTGATIYDSGPRCAPARDADGTYTWTAPIYPDMMTPSGKIFATTNNYYWTVSMLDAKFKTPSGTPRQEFRLDASGQLGKITDYGLLKAKVRYFGPGKVATNVVKGLVRVQAFTSPDFTGTPAGETYVKDASQMSSVSNITANAVILGLKPGKYYVRAFIDSDGNSEWAKWESWGYGNFVGAWDAALESVSRGQVSGAAAGSAYVFTPRSYAVTVGDMPPTAEIYIEDMDSDADHLPDIWEWDQKSSLATLGPPSGATFFTKVNTNLAQTVEAYTKLNASSSGQTYAPITLMNALISGSDMAALAAGLDFFADSSAGAENVAVRIDSFSLTDGLALTITSDVPTTDASDQSLFVTTDSADVRVVLMASKSPDFANAKEAVVKTIAIRANAETKEVVSADELRAAIDEAGLGDAAFFKVKLEQ